MAGKRFGDEFGEKFGEDYDNAGARKAVGKFAKKNTFTASVPATADIGRFEINGEDKRQR